VDNAGVVNCLLLNPYEGIRLIRAGRHWISGVYGYPLWRGIYVDECYDIGRIENCHFWPFWGGYKLTPSLSQWINTHAVAFEFARTDWQYVFNTFCFGYGVGYKFSASSRGACNGNFLGIGADCCWRAVLVEQAQPYGILITNGEFVGKWGSRDSVCVEIREGAVGKVSLVNCSFWGPIQRCVWLRSTSSQFSASACNFLNWDNGGGFSAIQLDAGRAIIQGNTFAEGDTHVLIGEKVESAIIMGNQAPFGFHVDNRAGKRAQIVGNEEYKPSFPEDAKTHYEIDIGSPGDNPFLRRWYKRENVRDWVLSGTVRWSSPNSEILLPVLPGKAYTITLQLYIPEQAWTEEAGLYLGSKRIIKFPASGISKLSGIIPPQDGDMLTLTVRCKGWIPAEIDKGSRDMRLLGVAVKALEMRAQGSEDRLFNANCGKWKK